MDLDNLLRARSDRDHFFAEHYSSPLPEEHQSGFQGLAYFPPDPAWVLIANYAAVEEQKVPVPSTAGVDGAYTMLGTATVQVSRAID